MPLNLQPEEITKAYMRDISSPKVKDNLINPLYGSSDYKMEMPDVDLNNYLTETTQPKNVGVGTGEPDTTQKQTEYNGDARTYVNELAGKYGISQQFGNKSNMYKSGSHPGLDIKLPNGTPLISPVDGKASVGYDPKGWGKFVRIETANGEVIQFSHLSDTDDLLKRITAMKNNLIKKGEKIGLSGGAKTDPNRGLSTGAHLDVSVKRGGKFINPLRQT